MIYACICGSEKFNNLASDQARLLYLMIYTHSDDFGRLDISPVSVKMNVCPGLNWTTDLIIELLIDIARVNLWGVYKLGDRTYAQLIHFDEHQKFNRERELMFPEPQGFTDYKQLNAEYFGLFSLKIRKLNVTKLNVTKDIPEAEKEAGASGAFEDQSKEDRLAWYQEIINLNFTPENSKVMTGAIAKIPLFYSRNTEQWLCAVLHSLKLASEIEHEWMRQTKQPIWKFINLSLNKKICPIVIAGAIDSCIRQSPKDYIAYFQQLLKTPEVAEREWLKIWEIIKQQKIKYPAGGINAEDE